MNVIMSDAIQFKFIDLDLLMLTLNCIDLIYTTFLLIKFLLI